MKRKELVLEDERVAHVRYLAALVAGAKRQPKYAGPRSGLWTGTGVPKPAKRPDGHLIGRVALRAPDHYVLDGGTDFYIGETHAVVDGVEVFSWSAEIACTFFRGIEHHVLCDEVAVVRSFTHKNGQIVDFADDVIWPDAPAEPFRKRGLSVPAAPKRPGMKLPNVTRQVSTAPPSAEAKPESHDGRVGDSVRAEELLRAQLRAPRANSLAPVLSTLQADQYELITLPAMESTVVEGQPGTGKTIIASHRAAYLVNSETPSHKTLDGKVLIVGPTDGYTAHVRAVVSRLSNDSNRIVVVSLPELMSRILKLRKQPTGPASNSWHDVDAALGIFARSSVNALKLQRDSIPTTREAYDYLRRNGSSRPITLDEDWAAYLRGLPKFDDAWQRRVHTPLLAALRWEVAKEAAFEGIEHIIVDEAQDVTALEWSLLRRMNQANMWTIVGDLNQRRSDHSPASWSQVLRHLGIEESDAPIRRLERGYRSTRPILEYANRLLSKDQRALVAFQTEGAEPVVVRSPSKSQTEDVVRQVIRLTDAYALGTVAVLTVDPASVRVRLRRAGWSATSEVSRTWERDGRRIAVMHPDAARGLEYDAVVVVEPADFPQNLGRQGPLYTALTRPNRELVVVHSKPLPDALRRR